MPQFFIRAVLPVLLLVGAAPGALSSARAADVVFLEIRLKDHKFEPAELKAPAGSPVIITLINDDATPEEFESAPLKFEKVVVGKGKISVKVSPQKPGRYTFFGEYHEKTAQGALVVE